MDILNDRPTRFLLTQFLCLFVINEIISGNGSPVLSIIIIRANQKVSNGEFRDLDDIILEVGEDKLFYESS